MINLLIMIILAFFPTCELEDGSTQSMCVWKDEVGAVVINWDYGKNYMILEF